MSKTPFMPLWVANFVNKTAHLDAKETGAYLLLLMALWTHGGTLPLDHKKLQRIARCGRDWPRIWNTLEPFFTVNDDAISQDRLSEELQKVNTKLAVNAHNGARGGRAKALKTKEQGLANATNSRKQIEPEPEPERAVQYSAREKPDDFQALSKALTEAIGEEAVARSPGLLVMADPLAWIAGGCDLQADILPTIAAIKAKGKRVGSWSYFSQAVYEARDRRLAPAPPVEARSATAPRRGGRRGYGDIIREIEERERRENAGENGEGFGGDVLVLPTNATTR